MRLITVIILLLPVLAPAQKKYTTVGSPGENTVGDYIFFLSDHGAVSDADLSNGSSTFGTDNTTAIQTVLDNAQTHPITVMWDGKYSTNGLTIYSNTLIIAGQGCGAILRTGADAPLFKNENLAFDGAPQDSNIMIVGGIWNGNGHNQTYIDDATFPTDPPAHCMVWYGVQNLTIKDFKLYNGTKYAIHAINVKHYTVESFHIDNLYQGAITNDGIHADGQCEDVTFRNGYIAAGDDAIGINADDQWDYTGAAAYPFFAGGAEGPVSKVLIENIVLESTRYGIRILSGGSRVDDVTIRNISGSTFDYWLVIDNYYAFPSRITTNGSGNIGNVLIDGVDVVVKKNNSKPDAEIATSIESLTIRGLRQDTFFTNETASIRFFGSGRGIDRLVIEDYQSSQRSSSLAIPHFLVDDSFTITEMIINNAIVESENSLSAPLVEVNSATVSRLMLNNIIARNCTNLVEIGAGATVSEIVANNIHHNPSATTPAFTSSVTVASIQVNNFTGEQILNDSLNFTTQRGYSFQEATQ